MLPVTDRQVVIGYCYATAIPLPIKVILTLMNRIISLIHSPVPKDSLRRVFILRNLLEKELLLPTRHHHRTHKQIPPLVFSAF